MIAFKLVLLLRLARFHYKNCKNTTDNYWDFEFSSFLQTYFSLWLILSSAYKSYYIFLYMTTRKINFEKSKYLRGSLPKSGPLDFATKNTFPLFFVGEEALVGIY